MRRFLCPVLSMCAISGLLRSSAAERLVPLSYDVDVAVVGGGCAGVAAAEAAARAGRRVLLLTPRNYLGDDLAGTMRLWLEPGERPEGDLAERLFDDPHFGQTPGLPYTYTADQPSQKPHLDTKIPSLLRRSRKATDPQHESVQYGADVTISADLGQAVEVREIAATSFLRRRDFEARDVLIQISADGDGWTDLGSFRFQVVGERQEFQIPVGRPIRFARLTFRLAKDAKRILIGEVKFLGKSSAVAADQTRVIRPLHAKKTLEQALRDVGASFLFGCYASDLLVDGKGRASGLVVSNRMGVQAVRAKAVVDASEHAALARSAKLAFRPATKGPRIARWVVIAGRPTELEGVSVRELPIPTTVYDLHGRRASVGAAAWYEYSFPAEVADQPVPRMAFEAEWRDRLYNETQLYTADAPQLLPLSPIVSRAPAASADLQAMPLDACRPADMAGLWVVGGCSDVPRELAGELMRPLSMLELGARVGRHVAEEIANRPVPANLAVAGATAARGDVREELGGLRPGEVPSGIRADSLPLPVFGRYDVVVVGGGTSGAPAGIAAARRGARTLVVEHLHGLGGVGTLGMIGKYWYGNRVGFAAESPENPIEARMQFYLSELRKAGGEVWFGTVGGGAVMDGDRVTGVVVATPFGRGIVEARIVIDGTGNADIAAAAGAETTFVEPFFALQNAHIPPREIGASYINGNCAPIDAADPLDVTAAMATFPKQAFDRGQIVASRERRRIVGDYELDWLDQINRRTFPDSITLAKSDYDSHGYQTHPFFMLSPSRPPGDHKRQFYSFVPYRCLLPKGLDGMLVVGLGLSAHRDAMPIVRMQPDLMNVGYAAGLAAATSAKTGKNLREIDIRQLQRELVAAGVLAENVLAQEDSYPVPTTDLEEAVASLPSAYQGLSLVLAEPERSRPLLHAAHDAAAGDARLAYAHVLGVLGDPHGVSALVAEARRRIEQGELAYRREADGMDRTTQLLWALGRSGDPQAMGALLALVDAGALTAAERFRAAVVSLGDTRSPKAAPALRRLLEEKKGDSNSSELMAACALRRCDPADTLARETLARFAAGVNGPFARLARNLLAE